MRAHAMSPPQATPRAFFAPRARAARADARRTTVWRGKTSPPRWQRTWDIPRARLLRRALEDDAFVDVRDAVIDADVIVRASARADEDEDDGRGVSSGDSSAVARGGRRRGADANGYASVDRGAHQWGLVGAAGRCIVTFRVQKRTRFGQRVVLVGNIGALGKWNALAGGARCTSEGDDWWTTSVLLELPVSGANAGDGDFPVICEYNYAIVDDVHSSGPSFVWRSGTSVLKLPAYAFNAEVMDIWPESRREYSTLMDTFRMNDPAMVRVTQYHTGGASLTKREMGQRGAVQTEIWFPSDERAVVVEDGVVVEMLDNTGNKRYGDDVMRVGDVYLGVVVNKVPNMKSLMVSCAAQPTSKSKGKMVLLRDGLSNPAALWKAQDKQDGGDKSGSYDESYDDMDGDIRSSGGQSIRSMRERLSRASKGAYGMYGYGDAVILEIIRDATEFKGPVATAEPSITGRFTVLKGTADGISAHTSKKLSVLNRDELADLGETLLRQYMKPYFTDDRCTFVGGGAHLIMRTAALNAPTEAVRDEVATLTKKWKSIIGRAKRSVWKAHTANKMVTPRLLWRDSQDFKALVLRELCSMNISSIVVPDNKMLTEMNESIALMRAGDEDMHTTVRLGANQMMKKILDSCFSERVPIQKTSSAELVIQSTEALTAIDVNMGSSRISVAEVNIAAAKTAAAEIRRRNLSGIIVIDFINVNSSREQIYRQVEAAFADAASRDRAKISFAPISPFGLMEITRERLALGPSATSQSQQVSINTPRDGRKRPPSVDRRTR